MNNVLLILLIIVLLVLIILSIYYTVTIKKTDYKVESARLPKSFDGFKIVQISDIHNYYTDKVIDMLKAEKPDLIAVTGDLIDSRHTHINAALKYAEKLVAVAPVYFITGNHEARFRGTKYDSFASALESRGIILLDDSVEELMRGNEFIQLIGLSDPLFNDRDEKTHNAITKMKLDKMNIGNGYSVLLSHRPELFDTYVSENIDLVLSGHTHGGQICVPSYGAILTPTQGFLPKYDSGEYKKDNTTMYISRGIGCSVFPFRLFNYPEVVVITLTCV